MVRIVVIEEHKPDIEHITGILDSQDDFEIVGTGKDGYDALILAEKEKPHIILMDGYLPMQDWGSAIVLIKSKSPQTSVIILSASYESEAILKAICSGVSGCLPADSSPEPFIAGIWTVYNGGSLMSPELFAKAYDRFSHTRTGWAKSDSPGNLFPAEVKLKTMPLPANITRIEIQVIIYIGRGFSNKEIAEFFSRKEGTIRNYITSILQKTGFRNRTQIAIYAFNIGLMDSIVR
ncbi:MAG: response regulator transcription factor [Spirochaetaceae bacterium]|jgi:DNA-binding NarL/FixJ family response regulator|nr:response regulator transcription factor [Spirochaetaceae bacterium]